MSTHPAAPEAAIVPESSLVPNAKLRQIYTDMLRGRAFRLRLAELAAEGRFDAALVPAAQEEAMLASIAAELREGVTLLGSRPDWLPALLQGVALAKIVRWLLAGAAARGLNDAARAFETLPARQPAQAAALLEQARAHKRKKGSLVLAYLGNDLKPESWHELFEEASRRRLPVLFVHRDTASSADLKPLLETTQMPHLLVDGTDALALYRAAQESTGRARRNLGPAVIQCSFAGDVGDDASFAAMEHHLTAKGAFSQSWKEEIEGTFRAQLEDAIQAAESRASARTARP